VSNFFTDVIMKSSSFNATERIVDNGLLEPKTRELVRLIMDSAAKMGIEVRAYETYRSQARQEELYKQGATQLRTVGVHHYGIACDIVRVVNGEPSWKGDFSFLGELARSAGMIWGGDWGNPAVPHQFIDEVHVQRCTVARQSQLFAGTWYPDDSYNPYSDESHPLFASAANLQANKYVPESQFVQTRSSRRKIR
jgi:hypothetical protein